MRLEEILVGSHLASVADIARALERQRSEGGRLSENLVATGVISDAQLAAVVERAPAIATSVADTGIAPRNLLYLLLKFMHLETCETVLDFSGKMKLPPRVIQQIIDDAVEQKLLMTRGAGAGGMSFSTRYTLTEQGRDMAREATDQNLYLGPAPVSLETYQMQVEKQKIAAEKLDEPALRKGFEGLVVPDNYFKRLLPAINAGRSVLLFGPPGNGKTTLSTRISHLFRHLVYIPYAVEVGGQIIKVFDHTLHKMALSEADAATLAAREGLHREGFDERWAACTRPVAMAGGEMTLEELDLQYSSDTKYYDAPLHVKALNGMLLIDDFGRQKFNPNDLLNRWIVPMESQIDFFKLNTGATFHLPFDVLLIFSTNLQPGDLVDPAFLRRIPYKVRLYGPTREEYHQIFEGVGRASQMEVGAEVIDYIVDTLDRAGFELAYYQPKFVVSQAVESCDAFGLPHVLTRELALEALSNLYFDLDSRVTEAAQ
jgi:hypothetical protein